MTSTSNDPPPPKRLRQARLGMLFLGFYGLLGAPGVVVGLFVGPEVLAASVVSVTLGICLLILISLLGPRRRWIRAAALLVLGLVAGLLGFQAAGVWKDGPGALSLMLLLLAALASSSLWALTSRDAARWFAVGGPAGLKAVHGFSDVDQRKGRTPGDEHAASSTPDK